MSTASDFAALNSYLATAAAAAATAEAQVAAGTPSSWACVATMFAIGNAQKAATALGVDIAPSPPPPPPPLELVAPGNVSATVGTAILPITLNASGGTPAYTFTATGLPSGLTLSGNLISGIPGTASPAETVTVKVTDSGSPAQSVSSSFTVTVAGATPPPPPPPSGVTVSTVATTGGPPAVRGQGYGCEHPGTGLMYYFGGNNTSGQLADTWSLNPATGAWVKLSATMPKNIAIAMGYDPISGHLIVFGGDNSQTFFNTTYSMDPTAMTPTWAQLSPATVPGIRSGHNLFNDPVSGKLLMYGGNTGTPTYYDDLWEWNGTNWVELSSALTGQARTGAFVDTLANKTAIIFGGFITNSSTGNDTHIWNGTTCTKANPATVPPARGFGGCARTGLTTGPLALIYGGANRTSTVNSTDCWTWDGTNWTQQTPKGTNMGGLSSQAMNFHSPTGKIVSAFGTAGATGAMSGDINTVYAITVGGGGSPTPTALAITTASLPNGIVGTAYGVALTSNGGTGTLEWSATGLPAGTSLSTGGALSGTPTTAGTDSVVVTLKDTNNDTPATKSYSVTIAPANTPPPPPPSGSPFYGTGVNNGWQNVSSGEASAKALGSSVVMFHDYWANSYPWSTMASLLKASPFTHFLLTTHLWASTGQYTLSQFLADLKAPNSSQLAGFVQIAQGMASTGKQCIIRLSAEPEGGWEPDNATADPADYSACLDIIIPAMSTAFPALEFQLDFDNGWFNITGTGTEFNPGSLYSAAVLALPQVKYIGMDTYAEFWGTVPSGQTMSQADWNQLLTNQYGLQWLQVFAAAHNLQVGIAEFGPSIRSNGTQVVGTGDDPFYVTSFFNWFKSLGNLAGYVTFFDVNASDGNHNITGGSFPQSLAAAKAAIA